MLFPLGEKYKLSNPIGFYSAQITTKRYFQIFMLLVSEKGKSFLLSTLIGFNHNLTALGDTLYLRVGEKLVTE